MITKQILFSNINASNFRVHVAVKHREARQTLLKS